jgi:hypothetical protein
MCMLVEIVVCIYASRRELCAFVNISSRIVCGSRLDSYNKTVWVWKLRGAVWLDKLRVLWYARLGHKSQRGL